MSNSIRLVLTLHNHQPVGNFDGVMEQAYQEKLQAFPRRLRRLSGRPEDRAAYQRLLARVVGAKTSGVRRSVGRVRGRGAN